MTAPPLVPTVSVVVAAYNSGRWLSETLASVLAQTYAPSEVIVVDDGSTDDTGDVARRYEGRVSLILQAHRGQPASRNVGLRCATGDFVAFCDADDLWHPRKLEAELAEAQDGGFAWVVCDAGWMLADGTPARIKMPPLRKGHVLQLLYLGNFIKSATPLIRREVLLELGGFSEDLEGGIGEDWDMWLRIAARYPLGVVHQQLATIRLHNDSVLAASSMTQRLQGLMGVIDRAAIREPARLGRLRKRAAASVWHQAAVVAFRQGRVEESARYFRKESDCQPWRVEARLYLLLCSLGPGVAQSVARLRKHLW